VSALAEHLADYLRMRRALGFELGRHGQVLPGFVAYLEAAGASRVTVEPGNRNGSSRSRSASG